MRRNQKGFGAVEGLLVIIIVLLIGFIGYYVYHTSNNANSTYNSAASTSDSTKVPTTTNKLAFKEMGVEVALPDDLKDLTYIKDIYTNDASYFLNTSEFKNLAKQCGDAAPQGFITVYSKSGQYPGQGNEGMNGLLKQFSSTYVAYGDALYGNPNCDDSVYRQLVALQSKLIPSVKEAFQHARQLQ